MAKCNYRRIQEGTGTSSLTRNIHNGLSAPTHPSPILMGEGEGEGARQARGARLA